MSGEDGYSRGTGTGVLLAFALIGLLIVGWAKLAERSAGPAERPAEVSRTEPR